MYNQFSHLVHTSYHINTNQDASSHINESKSQSLENFTIQLQEDTLNSLGEYTTLKYENQCALNSENQIVN